MDTGNSLIFALDHAQAALHVLADAAALRALCSPADVLGERWLLFTADGSPLRAQADGIGGYYLRPWASCASCTLAQVLHMIRTVHGPAGLDSVTAIARQIGIDQSFG